MLTCVKFAVAMLGWLLEYWGVQTFLKGARFDVWTRLGAGYFLKVSLHVLSLENAHLTVAVALVEMQM